MSVPIPVHLVAYDPNWPRLAEDYSRQLTALGTTLVVVHHIGSTAVVGLSAKPVIDLMPLVVSLVELEEKRPLLESLGYRWHGEYGVPGRRFCTLESETGERLAQLHCYEQDNPSARAQLAFRDYLRAHPDIAQEYQAEKYRARNLFPHNSTEYANEKGAWIRATVDKALDWFVGDEGLI